MGTRILQVPVTKVSDGDTIKVLINGHEVTIRMSCVDTEESQPGVPKPVTAAGLAASNMAKHYFALSDTEMARVDLEFDTDDPPERCLEMHRDNHGRLMAYIHKDGENYNLKLVSEGWSPYFTKYGRSRLYHNDMLKAEAGAMAEELTIWNPSTNANGPSRDYKTLLPWWALRDSIIEDYRRRAAGSVLSVRLDYPQLLQIAGSGRPVTVFCDLQEGVTAHTERGAFIAAGSDFHHFSLWLPNEDNHRFARLMGLLDKRYFHTGRGYVYVTGPITLHRDSPQIIVTELGQLSD